MPYEVRWTSQGAIEKFSGVLTWKDIYDADKILYGDYRFDAIKYLLVDFMQVEQTLLDAEHVSMVANLDFAATIYKRHLRMAIACALPPLLSQSQAYIGQSKTMGSAWDIRYFNDLPSAEAWAKA